MQDKAEIVCVLDRSGSMQAIIDDARGGFNTFLAEQQKIDKPARLTIVQFDDQYEVHYDGDLHKARPLDEHTYVPRGMTALLDAVGKTINTVGRRLRDMSERDRPNKVIFVIVTDGQENHSREFSRGAINNMISHQRERYSWEFIFLAANQDAVHEAGNLGIQPQFAMNYAFTPQAAKGAYCYAASAVASSRARGTSLGDCFMAADIDEEGNAVLRDGTGDDQGQDNNNDNDNVTSGN